MNSTFSTLMKTYTSWSALSSYLQSEEGGKLQVNDYSSAEQPFVLIRYVKGKSDLTKPHVRAFRSVVWDVLENRPVSVTPYKSMDGESLPETESLEGYTVEAFADGVLIGMFYDKYNSVWRIHTRSTLNAKCRFYSEIKTFATMFQEAMGVQQLTPASLSAGDNRDISYSWVLQHPENRIVVPAPVPRATLVQAVRIGADGVVTNAPEELTGRGYAIASVSGLTTTALVRERLKEFDAKYAHTFQGFVVKSADGTRWKMRGAEYNRIRSFRSNTPRRDFMWMTLWRTGKLYDYLKYFPEEKFAANAFVARWKSMTSDVYHIYVDVF